MHVCYHLFKKLHKQKLAIYKMALMKYEVSSVAPI